ncbi:acid protease [Amylostereum chailletii]|nr:acid protease [Amylostereum chailletii]
MQLALLSAISLSLSLASATPLKQGTKVALNKRLRLTDENGVVNTTLLRSHITAVASKFERGFHAFETNTGTKHPSDTSRMFKRATGSVPLTDDSGELWQGSISVGTPAKTFTVDFDTGSSDLFLPGVDCEVNCEGHTLFDPSASSSSSDTGAPFSLAFGDGSTVQGIVFTDTVTVGGLTATDQAVGDSSQYSAGFSIDEFPPDGLLGMAFPQISVFGANPFFQTLVSQDVVDAPEFGVKLATSGSELFLGGVDDSLFTGDFTQIPVSPVGFWQIPLDSVNANGDAAVTGLSSIIDTGTTLIVGDASTVAQFYAAVPGAADASNTAGPGFFTFPCASVPDVSLTFGGTDFAVSADTFNLGQLSAGSPDCVGGIAAADVGSMWVAGDVFLQNVYTSFDVGNTQVGFATLS